MKTMMAIAVGAALTTMALVNSAHADPAPCGDRQASIYFEKDEASLSPASREIVHRLAADAKSCGRAQITAQAPSGALAQARAKALRAAFAEAGVVVTLVEKPTLSIAAAKGDFIADRAASVRLETAPPVG